VARVAFHIYYGPTSVFILVWAVGVVLLYRATGRVLGIIAAHALWDLYAALAVLPWWWCPAASSSLLSPCPWSPLPRSWCRRPAGT